MSAQAARTGEAGDDRAALLRRGRTNRTVTRADEHSVPALPEGPERIDPSRFTGTDAERLAALEGALDQAGARAQAGIDMMKAWLDEQRGTVLREIQLHDLYKVKAATFEEYVADRWQMSRPRAYELITAAPVLRILSAIPDTRPAVSQALALAPAFERDGEKGVRDAVRQAEAEARTSGKRVTAAALTRTVQALGYRPTVVPAQGPAQPLEQDAARADEEAGAGSTVEEGARAVAILGAAVEEQRRLYDRLAGVVPVALAHDPGRAEHLLHDLRQYANRTAWRARPPAAEGTDPAPEA
ncbi:hypothetical protein AB0C97_36810 [Streptomyces goshikiensis]|uniref:hypothetical protein n=1 Tax=Streptomyces goshikiensis TaxID=1942 RepID=UPI0033DA3806